MSRILRCFAVCLMVVWVPLETRAAANDLANDWAEGTSDKNDGATRDYYNRGALLAWANKLGDWRDAAGKAQGDQAYATAVITDDDKVKAVTWDVTTLVQAWHKGTHQNQGFFLRLVKGNGPLVFASREATQAGQRPQLLLETSSGAVTLEATADTHLDSSTFRSLGKNTSLRIGRVLVRFSLAKVSPGATITKATLRMTTTKQYSGTNTVGVFRCQQGEPLPTTPPTPGIAAQFKDDAGIDKHPDVIFADDFEDANWKQGWTSVGGDYGTTQSDPARKFAPLFGKALWTRIAKGKLLALSAIYEFKKQIGTEPEAIYFRYYLRLGDNWDQTVQGGKMPGVAGTYDTAGWGGRRSNGSNGWSARGLFKQTIPTGDNPLGGRTPIGSYVYHTDQATTYGDNWVWTKQYGGFIAKNRWTCVEHYIKLNTPGQANGILKGWIDGRLAFEKSDIRYRTVSKLKIQRIWMNVYHGGTTASPYDQHMYIDNVVVAKRYIGPISSKLNTPPTEPTSEPPPSNEPTVDGGPAPEPGTEPSPQETPAPDTKTPTDETTNDQNQPSDNSTTQEPSTPDPATNDTTIAPDNGTTQDNNAPTQDANTTDTSSPSPKGGCGCHSSSPLLSWLALIGLLLLVTRRQTSA